METLKMREFCPKCAHGEVELTYECHIPPERADKIMGVWPRPERIKVQCQRCRAAWYRAPLDAQNQEQGSIATVVGQFDVKKAV